MRLSASRRLRGARGRPDRWWVGATASVVAVGLLARVLLATAVRPAHLDEAAVAVNLRDRGPGSLLTEPLELGQLAGVGWLLLADASGALLGDGLAAYRLPALLGGCAAVVLAVPVGRRLAGPAGGALLAAGVALNPALLRWSWEAKPYGLDPAVCLGVVLLALRAADRLCVDQRSWTVPSGTAAGPSAPRGRSRRALLVWAAGAAVGGWLTLPGLLVAAATGAGLLALALVGAGRARPPRSADPAPRGPAPPSRQDVVLAVVVAGVVSLPAAVLALRAPRRAALTAEWQDGFVAAAAPVPDGPLQVLPGPLGRWADLALAAPQVAPPRELAAVAVLLAAVGALRLLRRDRAASAVLLPVVAAAVLVDLARLHPLAASRLTLYLVPVVLALAVAAVPSAASRGALLPAATAGRPGPGWSRVAALTAVSLVVVGQGAALPARLDRDTPDTRPDLLADAVAAARADDEALVGVRFADVVLQWEGPPRGLPDASVRLVPSPATACPAGEPADLAGRTVWLVAAPPPPVAERRALLAVGDVLDEVRAAGDVAWRVRLRAPADRSAGAWCLVEVPSAAPGPAGGGLVAVARGDVRRSGAAPRW